jgi:hypothetical protein
MPGLDPGIHRISKGAFEERWIAGSSPAMTEAAFRFQTYLSLPAARFPRPGDASFRPRNRGRGECRALGAPAASRAKVKSTRVSHHRVAERFSIPRAMVLTAYSTLFPAIGLFVTVPGAMRSIVTRLTSASRRQNHMASPSAGVALVLSPRSVHRVPRPTFVTIAKRPSQRSAGC